MAISGYFVLSLQEKSGALRSLKRDSTLLKLPLASITFISTTYCTGILSWRTLWSTTRATSKSRISDCARKGLTMPRPSAVHQSTSHLKWLLSGGTTFTWATIVLTTSRYQFHTINVCVHHSLSIMSKWKMFRAQAVFMSKFSIYALLYSTSLCKNSTCAGRRKI